MKMKITHEPSLDIIRQTSSRGFCFDREKGNFWVKVKLKRPKRVTFSFNLETSITRKDQVKLLSDVRTELAQLCSILATLSGI